MPTVQRPFWGEADGPGEVDGEQPDGTFGEVCGRTMAEGRDEDAPADGNAEEGEIVEGDAGQVAPDLGGRRDEEGRPASSEEGIEELSAPARMAEPASGAPQHVCSECGKMYKHRNCLVKHAWEHHEAWPITRRLCQTKHQQVQMLEAAHILTVITGVAWGEGLSIGASAVPRGRRTGERKRGRKALQR